MASIIKAWRTEVFNCSNLSEKWENFLFLVSVILIAIKFLSIAISLMAQRYFSFREKMVLNVYGWQLFDIFRIMRMKLKFVLVIVRVWSNLFVMMSEEITLPEVYERVTKFYRKRMIWLSVREQCNAAFGVNSWPYARRCKSVA